MKKLIIVGAGIGNDLITMRGVKRLKEADVVLYDRLVDEKILQNLNCETIYVGKTPYKPSCNQCQINKLIEQYLVENNTVLRLKSGDPSIYSRSIEEIDVARKCGADIEIIPGVTTISLLSALIEAPLTARGVSSGVIFITGHKKEDNIENAYNWKAVVDLNMSIVVYMGVKNFFMILKKLVENGLKISTPVAIGEKLEFPEERILISTVGEILKNNYNISYPAVMLIGDVVAYSNKFFGTVDRKDEVCNRCNV